MPGSTGVMAKLWSDKNGGPTKMSYKDVGLSKGDRLSSTRSERGTKHVTAGRVPRSGRPLLLDARSRRDAGQTGHRSGAGIGQPHVFRCVGLPEDQIPKTVSPPPCPPSRAHRHLDAFSEALREIDLRFVRVGSTFHGWRS